MGFGILFIGYFFLLNFPYCDYTDAASAVLIMYALYKLYKINDGFRFAFYGSVGFTLLGIFELAVACLGMFIHIDGASPLIFLPAIFRHLIVAALSFLILNGIREVADEVGLREIAIKARLRSYMSVGVYALNIFLESALLAKFIAPKVLVTLYAFTIVATLAVIVMNLCSIYSCYMRICMPEDYEMEEKPSKFGFVNEFRRREEEKSREFAEYKLKKMQSKNKKQRKK